MTVELGRREVLAASLSLAALPAAGPAGARPAQDPAADEIRPILESLVRRGWGEVFAPHGLDLEAAAVEPGRLEEPLAAIDRARQGFEDFSSAGRRGVEPGDPALSLIYHALASPDVHPPQRPGPTPDWQYPALADLDALENYIYGRRRLSRDELADLTPQVLAYHYRPAGQSAHGAHADLVFSRTLIARVGTEAPLWDARRRCFTPQGSSPAHLRALPGRVAVFLTPQNGDARNTATLAGGKWPAATVRGAAPVMKLYDGAVVGEERIAVSFAHDLVSRKLAAAFDPSQRHTLDDPGGARDAPPFEIRSVRDGGVTWTERAGASLLIGPPAADLVRPARLSDGRMATFTPPADNEVNRGYTSLRLYDRPWPVLREGLDVLIRRLRDEQPLPPYRYPSPRNAPEYVNIRHRVTVAADGSETITDMLSEPADREKFLDAVAAGGGQAALFLDGAAEGAVGAVIDGLPERTARPLYAVLTAPDLFPYASQLDLHRWVERRRLAGHGRQFRQGSADPLCFGDLPANTRLLNPATGAPAFAPADRNVVAIFSPAARGAARPAPTPARTPVTTFLTDGASNIFAPGWDVTYGGERGAYFYTVEGLGSPFPEDAKLCAAANGMWPAVSPDASRTFGLSDSAVAFYRDSPTALPLMDDELGFHPGHPLATTETRGWDGEQGPFLTADGFVDFSDIERADYVANALQGYWRFDRLIAIDAQESIARMDALGRALDALDAGPPEFTRLWLVSALRVADWRADPRGGPLGLAGSGFRFLFVRADSADAVSRREAPGRLRTPYVGRASLCLVADGEVRVMRAPRGDAALALYR